MRNFVTAAVKGQFPKKRQLKGKTHEQGHSVSLLRVIKLGVFAGFKFHLRFTVETM